MNNCSVKQYKAAVNNPNLPVIELMQQITLDAIALSGNNAMTDEQKYALNHFYYQLGAPANSSLWQKIQGIVLPFLANDAQHSVADYKSNTIYSSTLSSNFEFDSDSGYIRVKGGDGYYHELFEYDFDGDDFSFATIIPSTNNSNSNTMRTTLADGECWIGKINNANSVITGLYSSSSSSSQIYRYYSGGQASITGHAFSFGHESSKIDGLFLINSAIEKVYNLPSYESGVTYPSYSTSKMRLYQYVMGGLIVGKAMTSEELALVFTSLINLRAAFV